MAEEAAGPGTVIVQGIVPWRQINTTQHQTALALARLGWRCVYLEPRTGLSRVRPVERPRPEVQLVAERAPWLPGRVADRLAPGWRLHPLRRCLGRRPLWLYRTSGPLGHLQVGQQLERLLRPDLVSLEIWDRLDPGQTAALSPSTSAATAIWVVHPSMSPVHRGYPVVPNAASGRAPLVPQPGPPGPHRVGYVGSINPWFAPDLVLALLERLPAVVCELIGAPCALSPTAAGRWARLRRHPRVVWRGAAPHDEAMRRVATWRAGLLPRNDSFGAQESDPLKVLDYFSCGIPCVTSHRRTYERFPDAAFYGPTPEAFAQAAAEALARGPEVAAACRRHAAAWTWADRARRVWELASRPARASPPARDGAPPA